MFDDEWHQKTSPIMLFAMIFGVVAVVAAFLFPHTAVTIQSTVVSYAPWHA